MQSSVTTEAKTNSTPAARIAIGDGLYLLVMVAAAIMRFSDLNVIPLSPAEAREALAVWQFLQPGSATFFPDSPAYFSLTSLLAAFLGVSDTVMRLVPAIFGAGTVALPWLLRKQIGIVGALTAAALLAASPLNSAISRMAGGDAIAIFAVLLSAAALWRMEGRDDRKWVYTLAAAVGIGLSSSPLFYGGLLTLILAFWVTRLTSEKSAGFVLPERTAMFSGAVVSLLVLIGLSTRFLSYPAGLGASAQLIGTWLEQFGIGDNLFSVLAPFTVLMRYEIALLVLGTAAFIWVIWKNNPSGFFFTLWLLAALVLMILQSSTLSNALLATLPGYLLVGLVSNYLLGKGIIRWTWALTAGLLLIGAIMLVNLTRYLRVSVYEQDLSYIWMGILAIALGGLVIYYAWAMTDASLSQGIWLAVFLLLLAYQWGTAWHLTHRSANDPRESWVAQGTDDDVFLLAETLREISRQATNSDGDLRLLTAVDSPVLRWYLRGFWQATIGEAVPPGIQHQAIISRAAADEPAFGADYVGTDFGLLHSGSTNALESDTPLSDLLRWWLFHESTAGTITDRVILWVRSDLVVP